MPLLNTNMMKQLCDDQLYWRPYNMHPIQLSRRVKRKCLCYIECIDPKERRAVLRGMSLRYHAKEDEASLVCL